MSPNQSQDLIDEFFEEEIKNDKKKIKKANKQNKKRAGQ